ncbi:Uncharacterised protein [Actinobacillus pleuropneumoniae]|nr:Uncharacterised protein [Actinobacillus pleuropneumoniae]
MISKVGQIMVYVYNQDQAVKFWTEMLGFEVIAEESNGEMRWIEIAPTKDAETSIILHDKEFVAKMSPRITFRHTVLNVVHGKFRCAASSFNQPQYHGRQSGTFAFRQSFQFCG